MTQPPNWTQDGKPDGRGQADGSKATRFSKGDGRRRPGRPKRARDIKTEVREIEQMTVSVTLNGRRRKISSRQAMLMRVREKALQGDLKAVALLERIFQRFEEPSVEPDRTAALLEADQAILRRGEARGVLPARQTAAEEDA